MKRALCITALLLVMITTAACNTAGPRGLRSGATAYNQAVADTKSEQMLLNLVRMRYRDPTQTLEVSSISSQYIFSTSGNASWGLKSPGGDKSYGAGAGIGFSEKPTISFNPLRGEDFVRQVMSPIAPETLALMFHSGWNLDRVWRCVVQGLNGVDNAPNASSPTPARAPVYEEFKQVAELLKVMQKDNLVELGAGDSEGSIQLRIADEAADSPAMNEIADILGLTPGRTSYDLVPTVLKAPEGKIGISLRSLSGVFYFLSHGVEAPAEHEEAGLVTVTRTAEGGVFDWRDVTGDLLRIRSSSSQPDNAAVRVKYRGYWFYIADNDLNSKSTFSMLGQLSALQAGGVPSSGPVITLPLG
jgi:hypothetical protein